MLVLASPIVDWNAMWKICVVALAAGAGVVVMFGFVLLGLKIADRSGTDGTQGDGRQGAGTHSAGARAGGWALSIVCAIICAGVVVLGVYAMTKKGSSSSLSKPAKSKSALVLPASPQGKLIASSR
jgi:hypothetical protein